MGVAKGQLGVASHDPWGWFGHPLRPNSNSIFFAVGSWGLPNLAHVSIGVAGHPILFYFIILLFYFMFVFKI
jgi:hypothetical protein